jgi:hypothetical protein
MVLVVLFFGRLQREPKFALGCGPFALGNKAVPARV